MALDATRLGARWKAVFVAAGAADNDATTALCNGLVAELLAELKDYGEVVPLTLPDPNAMAAGPYPVTGRAKIT